MYIVLLLLTLFVCLQMSQPEVCRNFLAGRCAWGNRCHRSHNAGGVTPQDVAPVAITSNGPERADVRGIQPQIPVSPGVQVVDGFYTDRFHRRHRLDDKQPAGSSVATVTVVPAAPTTLDPSHAPSDLLPSAPISQPQPPPITATPPPNHEQYPENLDAQRLSRAAELDPRPSRVSVLLQYYIGEPTHAVHREQTRFASCSRRAYASAVIVATGPTYSCSRSRALRSYCPERRSQWLRR